MKLLIIYSNKNINFNKNFDFVNDIFNFDYIQNKDCIDINELYWYCPKYYSYYLFIDKEINISYEKINDILLNIIKYKPAIIYLDKNIKIYHRSIIHYVYPLLNYKKYGNYIFNIQRILEEPLDSYTILMDKKIIKLNNYKLKNDRLWILLYNWFKSCIKKKYKSNNNNYIILDEEINKINFLEKFNVYEYFNVNHEYFNMKRLRFHKNNKEIYGYCTMHHFIHDFHNINRNSIINHLIKKFNYKIYLEIGVYNCYHFNDVYIDKKYGVDPSPKLDDIVYKKWEDKIYKLKSEDFFKNLDNSEKFDIIFIDGCLYEYNVMNDVINSLNHLNDNGIIILHDCNPPSEFFQRDNYNKRHNGIKKGKLIWNNREYTDRHWNGKAWKVISQLRMTRKDLEIYVVDCDWGVGIIKKSEKENELFNMVTKEEIENYEIFIKYRKYILNLITPEKFLDIF
jgi:hypothetical protein